MTKDEALKMAIYVIEAFGRGCDSDDYFMDISEAINACKEALDTEQVREDLPAQGIELEWYNKGWTDAMFDTEFPSKQEILKAIFDAVYSQYPKKEWQELTDKEIFNLSQNCDLNHILGLIDYGRAVEQALKDKNSV
jgi:hypothetical protein